jgi:uncharacterized protein YciI
MIPSARSLTDRLTLTGLAFACTLNATVLRASPNDGAAQPARPPVQFVVMHHPGVLWRSGVSAFEQPEIRAHIDHYRTLYAEGKLALGGPFLDEGGGGMMLAKPGVSREALIEFAAADPAVKSGLLTFTVRVWMIGMDANSIR